jgi:putative SOS response-associated peptidase YedK
VPVVVNESPSETGASASCGESTRALLPMRWGLVRSHLVKEKKPDYFLAFNARSESVASKPMFRDLVSDHRCVVVVDGFFEWLSDELGEKQPYFVHPNDSQPLLVAGLYSSWESADGSEDTCTLLTRDSCKELAWLHDRMPVVLRGEDEVRAWLDPAVSIHTLLSKDESPIEGVRGSPKLLWHPVSKQVNSVKFEGPTAADPIDLEALRKKREASQITRFFRPAKRPADDSSSGKKLKMAE